LETASNNKVLTTQNTTKEKDIKTERKRSETTSEKEDEYSIKFSAWDFAGQEIYYSTHTFFLSPRSIYLIVFNMVDEQSSRIEYWLNTVQSRASNPVVVLVGTHLDDKRCTSSFVAELTSGIEERYRKKFPFIKAVAFVSCHTGK